VATIGNIGDYLSIKILDDGSQYQGFLYSVDPIDEATLELYRCAHPELETIVGILRGIVRILLRDTAEACRMRVSHQSGSALPIGIRVGLRDIAIDVEGYLQDTDEAYADRSDFKALDDLYLQVVQLKEAILEYGNGAPPRILELTTAQRSKFGDLLYPHILKAISSLYRIDHTTRRWRKRPYDRPSTSLEGAKPVNEDEEDQLDKDEEKPEPVKPARRRKNNERREEPEADLGGPPVREDRMYQKAGSRAG
jgi:hypothetical protein